MTTSKLWVGRDIKEVVAVKSQLDMFKNVFRVGKN